MSCKAYQMIKLTVNRKKESSRLKRDFWDINVEERLCNLKVRIKKISQKLHYALIINTSCWSEHSLSRSVTLWYEVTWIIDYTLSNNISSWSKQLLV